MCYVAPSTQLTVAMITQIGNREVNLVYEMENGEHSALEYFQIETDSVAI